MDVQALAPVAGAFPLVGPSQSPDGVATSPAQVASAGGSSAPGGATSVPAAPFTSSSTPPQTPQHHDTAPTAKTSAGGVDAFSNVRTAYKFVSNPVQVVIVFTNAADGQEIAQLPPQYLVQLVKFDHETGEFVDRNA